MIIATFERRLAALATVAAALGWVVFLRADLVLSHYDAKAHLVVARRVIDNLTPGWQQIGAVWLPLPHLLQILPMQIDSLYRTGASGSLVSIACMGTTAYAFARLILLATGSRAGALASTGLLVANPNLIYLHATPMTEPLLLAVTSLAMLWLFEWIPSGEPRIPLRLGVLLFAATWTRYEAWPVLAASGVIAVASWVRNGLATRDVLSRAVSLAAWPVAAAALFAANSRITVGSWFVSDGFYVPDPAYQGRPLRSLVAIWWGTHELSGYVMETAAVAGSIGIVAAAVKRRDRTHWLLVPALAAAAALPFVAFVQGHPFRIRYMIPVVAASALGAGFLAGLVRKGAPVLAAALIAAAVFESPPWSQSAPMLAEAQWDVPASRERRSVSRCLSREYRGDKVLASMGSLAHYMQELSWDGFAIADFVHEGNGVIWETALATGPAPHVGWMLVEEQAEGGDVLAQRLRRDPAFAAGFDRVCEGGGVALYRRRDAPG